MFKLKTEKNKNLYLVIFEAKIVIIKSNSENNAFSAIQDINIQEVSNIFELSTGQIALLSSEYGTVYILSKKSDEKFELKFTLTETKANHLFETEEKYLCVTGNEKTILYDLKSNMEKVKVVNDCKIYINEKIAFIPKRRGGGSSVYNEFLKKEIYNMKEALFCVIKKKDGTYLAGGEKSVFQFSFDENGLCHLITKVDSGYGYYRDDYSEDCIFSNDDSRYYGVGFIHEYEIGDIINYNK